MSQQPGFTQPQYPSPSQQFGGAPQQWQPQPQYAPPQPPAAAPSADELLRSRENHPALPVGGPYNGQPAKSPQGQYVGGRIVEKTSFPVMVDVQVFDQQTGQMSTQRIQKRTKKGNLVYGVRFLLDVQGVLYNFWADGSTLDELYTSRLGAVIKAIAAAQAKTADVGGELYVAWTRQVPMEKGSPANDWAAAYKPPAAALTDSILTPPAQAAPGIGQVAQQYVAAQPAPVMQQPAAAQMPVQQPVTPAQVIGEPPF